MLTGVVSFFLIFAVVNGDVYNEIRSEEEKRHNTVLSQYVRAAIGGALHTLFPSVNETEKAEADKLLADVYPIGDPSRPLPDNEEKIESLLCRDHKDRGHKILAYVRKRWPTHLITQVTIRIGIHSVGKKNDEYCRDAASRSVFTKNASLINAQNNELNVIRNNYIDQTTALIHVMCI